MKQMLIVEDTLIGRKVLENAFKDEYEVFLAFDGADAINLLKTHQSFSIVLLDLLMPNKNGYEVLLYLKNNPNLVRIPVVVTTSIDETRNISELIDLGACDVITKPFDIKLIKKRVNNAIKATQYDLIIKNDKYLESYSLEINDNPFYQSTENIGSKLLSSLTVPKLYDAYRLVDPNNYSLYFYTDKKLIKSEAKCYETWGRDTPCINCVSRLSCKSHHKHYKLETLNNKNFLITAYSINFEGKIYCAEMINDCTNTLMLLNDDNQKNINLNELMKKYDEARFRDMFSGLYNKIYIEDYINKAIKNKKQFSIGIMDFYKFKTINDTYGHLAGDEVIQYFSSILQKTAKIYDITVGRIGGDEFMIICMNNQNIEAILEEIRNKLINHYFKKDTLEFTVDVAYGIATLQNNDNYETVFTRADHKMYDFKRSIIK